MAAVVFLIVVTAALAAPAAAQQPVFGNWRVTGSKCPSSCAIGSAEASKWRGRVASYSDTLARFAEHSCVRPRYTVAYWPASGTYGGAHLADFGITADSAMVVDVSCPSQRTGDDPRWQVPGAFLIVKDARHLLMVWESAFFELTRM